MFCCLSNVFSKYIVDIIDHWKECPHGKWKPETHKNVREELLRCLDKIATLERSFTDAQGEIQRLRKYIKVRIEINIFPLSFS